ncbi:UNVERIFIED_CONTAM: hypothetical protein K2H54_021588 [Gekko kuhli]
MAPNSEIKYLTLNCRGLNSPVKRKRLTAGLLRQHVDIIFLQETHLKGQHDKVLPSVRYTQQYQAPGEQKIKQYAWRLNPKLLLMQSVTDSLEIKIKEYFQHNISCGVSSHLVWDAFKAVLRGKLIAIASHCKKENSS